MVGVANDENASPRPGSNRSIAFNSPSEATWTRSSACALSRPKRRARWRASGRYRATSASRAAMSPSRTYRSNRRPSSAPGRERAMWEADTGGPAEPWIAAVEGAADYDGTGGELEAELEPRSGSRTSPAGRTRRREGIRGGRSLAAHRCDARASSVSPPDGNLDGCGGGHGLTGGPRRRYLMTPDRSVRSRQAVVIATLSEAVSNLQRGVKALRAENADLRGRVLALTRAGERAEDRL